MRERIACLVQRRRNGDIGDAAYAALYFLHWQAATHGRRFASRRFKQDPRPEHHIWLGDLERMGAGDARATLLHYFERYGFLGVIPNVGAALCAWLRGQWPLTLFERIPNPLEVLRMQAQGTRPVTVIAEFPRSLQPVLTKPNAHAFMIHDLEHAYKYFHNPPLHAGQKRFFATIQREIERGMFADYRHDPIFAAKFDYLISDMNTHVMHSLQFLRAILIEFYLRSERKPANGALSPAACTRVNAIMESLGLDREGDVEV